MAGGSDGKGLTRCKLDKTAAIPEVTDNYISFKKDNKEYMLFIGEFDINTQKDEICDTAKTICYNKKTKTITLDEFIGQELTIKNVSYNKDNPTELATITINVASDSKIDNSALSSLSALSAALYSSNPLKIISDSKLDIISQSSGIKSENNISFEGGETNITYNAICQTTEVTPKNTFYDGLYQNGHTLSLENANINITNQNITGTCLSVKGHGIYTNNANVTIDDSSLIDSTTDADGLSFNGTTSNTIKNEGYIYVNIGNYPTSVGLSINGLILNNSEYMNINSEDKASLVEEVHTNINLKDYNVIKMINSTFNNTGDVRFSSSSKKAILYASNSKINLNDGILLIDNYYTPASETEKVTAIELFKSSISVDDSVVTFPKTLNIEENGDTSHYRGKKIMYYATSKIFEDLDATLTTPEAIDKEATLFFETVFAEELDEYIKDYKASIPSKETPLISYHVTLSSGIIESYPEGNYTIKFPAPGSAKTYDKIKLYLIDTDIETQKDKLGKELEYTIEGDYIIVTIPRCNIYLNDPHGSSMVQEFLMTGMNNSKTADPVLENPKTGAIIGASSFVVLGGLAIYLKYASNKKKKMFNI